MLMQQMCKNLWLEDLAYTAIVCLTIKCISLNLSFVGENCDYWESLCLPNSSWKCFGFPRKWCYDSRFLHLHQFLSGNFLASQPYMDFHITVWLLSSLPSSGVLLSHAMLHFRLRKSRLQSSGCIVVLSLSVLSDISREVHRFKTCWLSGLCRSGVVKKLSPVYTKMYFIKAMYFSVLYKYRPQFKYS